MSAANELEPLRRALLDHSTLCATDARVLAEIAFLAGERLATQGRLLLLKGSIDEDERVLLLVAVDELIVRSQQRGQRESATEN